MMMECKPVVVLTNSGHITQNQNHNGTITSYYDQHHPMNIPFQQQHEQHHNPNHGHQQCYMIQSKTAQIQSPPGYNSNSYQQQYNQSNQHQQNHHQQHHQHQQKQQNAIQNNNSYYYDIDDEFSDILSAPGSPSEFANQNHHHQQQHNQHLIDGPQLDQMMTPTNYMPYYEQQHEIMHHELHQQQQGQITTIQDDQQHYERNQQQHILTSTDHDSCQTNYAYYNNNNNRQQQQQQQQQYEINNSRLGQMTYCDSYGSQYVMSPDSSGVSVFSAASSSSSGGSGGSGSPGIQVQYQYQRQQHQQCEMHQLIPSATSTMTTVAVNQDNNTTSAYSPNAITANNEHTTSPPSSTHKKQPLAQYNHQVQQGQQLKQRLQIAAVEAGQVAVAQSKQLTTATHSPQHRSSPIHLWEFLKELLQQQSALDQHESTANSGQQMTQTDDSVIRWLDKQKGVFKIEDSVLVAKLWGRRKNKPKMNYDKLSRSIRQYYKKGIMKKTDRSQRLVYQFCSAYCH